MKHVSFSKRLSIFILELVVLAAFVAVAYVLIFGFSFFIQNSGGTPLVRENLIEDASNAALGAAALLWVGNILILPFFKGGTIAQIMLRCELVPGPLCKRSFYRARMIAITSFWSVFSILEFFCARYDDTTTIKLVQLMGLPVLAAFVALRGLFSIPPSTFFEKVAGYRLVCHLDKPKHSSP